MTFCFCTSLTRLQCNKRHGEEWITFSGGDAKEGKISKRVHRFKKSQLAVMGGEGITDGRQPYRKSLLPGWLAKISHSAADAHKVLQRGCQVWYNQVIPWQLTFSACPECCWVPGTTQKKSPCSKTSLREYFPTLKLLPQKMHSSLLPPTRVVYGLPKAYQSYLANIFLATTDFSW